MFNEAFCLSAYESICHDQREFVFDTQRIRLEKLHGDASHKTFYRFTIVDQSYILVYIPEGIPASEETFIPAFSTPSQGIIFAQTSVWLAQHVKQVPTIFFHDKASRIFVLEDGGDVTLHQYYHQPDHDVSVLKQAYLASIDWLVRCHENTVMALPDSIMRRRHFSEQALYQECAEFIQYSPKEDGQLFQPYFSAWAQAIAHQPQVLIHRDMQSKNIMLVDKSIFVIDTQDMCMGSCFYDVASLLYDPYVTLPEAWLAEFTVYFHSCMVKAQLIVDNVSQTQVAIRLNAVQRLLKAAGRYQRLRQLKNNASYMQYYDVALNRAKSCFDVLVNTDESMAT